MAQVEVYVLRGARLAELDGKVAPGGGGVVDVGVAHGRVAVMAPRISSSEIPSNAQVIDLEGRWLLPGLVDRHVHFPLWARQRARFDVSAARSALQAGQLISEHLRTGPMRGDVMVGRGFQDALWPDRPAAEILDDAATQGGQPGLPIVLISHDLHSVWLNTAAAAKYGLEVGGLLREDPAFDVQRAVDAEEGPSSAGFLADAIAAAVARGVTEIVDFHMDDNLAAWRNRIASGLDKLRVRAALYSEHLPAALARGDRTGDVVPGTRGLLTVGPLKVFGDGSLNTRTALCRSPYPGAHPADGGGFGFAAHEPDALNTILNRAASAGLQVALHAIGDLAVTRALDAFAATGAQGSIEHAQLVADADLTRFSEIGVAASVQPAHLLDDLEIANSVWGDRVEQAFSYGRLAAAGARLLMGSDAPVAPLDPWLAVAAAAYRSDGRDPKWDGANALTPAQALAASAAYPRIEVGRHGDLVAVEENPLTASAAQLREMPVALTVCAGRVTYQALS